MGSTQHSFPKDRLDTEVQYLKGVGPRLANILSKVGIKTVRDVLRHYPRRYEDRSNLPPLSQLRPGEAVTVRGHLLELDTRPSRGGMVLIRALIGDRTGQVALMWFNQPWISKKLAGYSGELLAYGVVKQANWGFEIQSPEIELIDDDSDAEQFARIVPVYPLSEGVPQWVVRRAAEQALAHYLDAVAEVLPANLRRRYGLEELAWCLTQIHRPESDEARIRARRRLVFEEFFAVQLSAQMKRVQAKQEQGISFPISSIGASTPVTGTLFAAGQTALEGGSIWDEVARILPFEPTNAQRRVIGEIWADMESPTPMNRLLQGDVGSGKTAVALCAMLAAVRCGYQAALMAPTEILAEQHYINLHRMLLDAGVEVALLNGKMPARAKKKALAQAASGEAQVVVGTHALIQEHVEFAKLGLAIVDEQHRFGVVQRAALRQKSGLNPDVLFMTATPIPRTLTMAFYGHLDLSVIDELPPGRRPVITHLKLPHQRAEVYQGVRRMIEEGRQAYFVCPMIADSEKMQTQAAIDLHYRLQEQEFKGFRVGLLHGQMKTAEKEEVMARFRSGETHILVSTVVIEVGVDVPNASVMVIEDANRFGLSQLHQLRGRVGRGASQSYCILIADLRSEDARQRLETIRSTSDGFKIAEEDLQLRGPGELIGTRQSGNLDFHVADLVRDAAILEEARQAAAKLLEYDPDLSRPEYQPLRALLREPTTDLAAIAVS